MAEHTPGPEQLIAATFLLPASSSEPLVIELPHYALRLVVVNNGSVNLLDDSWSAGGVYVLLGLADGARRYSAYVGKAPSGLRSRVSQHVRSKEGWDRALLVAHISYGFSSAAVGWLEGRLWDVLRAAPAAELRNAVRPRDETLPLWDRRELERYIAPITAVLRAIGADPDTPDQAPQLRRRRGTSTRTARRTYTETVRELLDAELLTAGVRLRPLPEGYDTSAEILDSGQLQVDAEVFDTPSAAGVHVLGRPVNGWDFWGAASGDGTLVPLTELRRRFRATSATADMSEPTPADIPAEPEPADEAVSGGEESSPPAESTEASPDQGRRAPRRFAGTLSELARAGLLETRRVHTKYKGQRYEAELDGENGLRVADGAVFASPSLAAAHITGRPTNGWTFWKAEQAGKPITLAALRALLQEHEN